MQTTSNTVFYTRIFYELIKHLLFLSIRCEHKTTPHLADNNVIFYTRIFHALIWINLGKDSKYRCFAGFFNSKPACFPALSREIKTTKRNSITPLPTTRYLQLFFVTNYSTENPGTNNNTPPRSKRL